jgi:membrane-associated phospholipid phosphatase
MRSRLLFFFFLGLAGTDAWLNGSPLIVSLNLRVSSFFIQMRNAADWVTLPMAVLTFIGNDLILFLLAMILGAWLIRGNRMHDAIWLLSTAVFARIFGIVSKLLMHSPRPRLIAPPPYIHVSLDYGFPSGHALMSTVILGSIAFLVSRQVQNRKVALCVIIFSASLIIGIGLSRIYLGVHWANDIIGGYLFGASILAGALFAREKWMSR